MQRSIKGIKVYTQLSSTVNRCVYWD